MVFKKRENSTAGRPSKIVKIVGLSGTKPCGGFFVSEQTRDECFFDDILHHEGKPWNLHRDVYFREHQKTIAAQQSRPRIG